jgi:hypothetical protein
MAQLERRHLIDRRHDRFASDDIYRRLRAKFDEVETERRQRARRENGAASPSMNMKPSQR